MDTITKQVAAARRRLLWAQFARLLAWSWLAAFAAAAVAIGVGKVWPLGASQAAWLGGWLFGAGVLGLGVAAILTWRSGCSRLEAAREIDRRFGLQERVATALGLDSCERDEAMGQALVRDASHRVARIRVAERFGVRPGRASWGALAAATLAIGLAWLAPERSAPAAAAAAKTAQPQNSTQALEKKLAEKRAEAREQGLAEADALLKKLEEGTRKLAESKPNEKQSLVALNDLAKDLQSRREKLQDSASIKQRLNQLNDLEHGPADKMGQALRQGDLKAARQELDKLAKQLAAEQLKPDEQRKLGEQLEAMQKKLDAIADAHEQAQRELERQLAQRQQAGDQQAAERLRRQLDELQRQGLGVRQMKEMSQRLGKAGKCLQAGDCQAAQGLLAQTKDDLDALAKSDEELAMIDDALDQIRDAKNGLTCKECDGAGCGACRAAKGEPQHVTKGGGKDWGTGVASHRGPEDKSEKGFYDSRVPQKVGAGSASVEGHARGVNRKGEVEETIKQRFESAERDAADPLTNERLPRDYREHARRYFESLRGAGQ